MPDPEVSDADFARLVELCRECGVQEPNIGYQVDAQRDSRPASRPQAPPGG